MKTIILTIVILLILVSTANSQNNFDSTDNIKSRFGAGYGIVADFDNIKPVKSILSFHLIFTLKPITKYLFIEFALTTYSDSLKYENNIKGVTTRNISISPLFGKGILKDRLFLYLGPTIDVSLSLPLATSGYGLNFRSDYSFTKIFAMGLNLRYIHFSGFQNKLNYLFGNINMSLTL